MLIVCQNALTYASDMMFAYVRDTVCVFGLPEHRGNKQNMDCSCLCQGPDYRKHKKCDINCSCGMSKSFGCRFGMTIVVDFCSLCVKFDKESTLKQVSFGLVKRCKKKPLNFESYEWSYTCL